MFKLIRYIQLLIYLSQQAHTFVDETSELLPHDEEKAEQIKGYCRRIVTLGIAFPLIYAVLVPLSVPWLFFFLSQREDSTGAVLATVVGMIFSMGTFLFYIFAGVALGCLFAPDAFLSSPVGKKWLELIGTKSHTGARVVCAVTTMTGFLIAVGLALSQLWLMNGPAFRPH